jgi:DNA-binding response OmpR family regulator
LRILVIEDDPKTATALLSGLRHEGYDAVVARTGDEGLAALASAAFQLVVLDWMLPGRDGIDILKHTRARGLSTRVLLLTARDAVEDRVLGLERGEVTEPNRKQLGDLTLDVEHRRVTRGGDEITLTPREFDLLAYLLRHHRQTVTRRMLAADVWREPQRVTPLDNVIDVHVAHLRRKLDEGRTVKLIHTVRGVGFVLREESPA